MGGLFAFITTLLVIIVGSVGMYGCPQYNVYEQRLAGEAALARAQYERQVQVQEAEGKLAAAAKLAEVEVTRAGGVARANAIIGESLKNNEAYLKYLWITDISGNNRSPTVIYVPTEANLPLLEAGQRPHPQP